MNTYSFTRELRLLTPADFSFVFQDAINSSDHCFTILARRNQLEHPRLGLTIAKKRIKRAVGRNRIKRLVRENFRLNQHKLPHVDIVVMVKNGIEQYDNAQLNQQLDYLWRKLAKRLNAPR